MLQRRARGCEEAASPPAEPPGIEDRYLIHNKEVVVQAGQDEAMIKLPNHLPCHRCRPCASAMVSSFLAVGPPPSRPAAHLHAQEIRLGQLAVQLLFSRRTGLPDATTRGEKRKRREAITAIQARATGPFWQRNALGAPMLPCPTRAAEQACMRPAGMAGARHRIRRGSIPPAWCWCQVAGALGVEAGADEAPLPATGAAPPRPAWHP